jgi:two-component system NtrC family sensor kinase
MPAGEDEQGGDAASVGEVAPTPASIHERGAHPTTKDATRSATFLLSILALLMVVCIAFFDSTTTHVVDTSLARSAVRGLAVILVALAWVSTMLWFGHFRRRAQALDGQQAHGAMSSLVDQRLAHRTELEELDFLRAVARGVPGFIVVADRDCVIRYANREPAGFTMIGTNVLDLIRPEDKDKVIAAHEAVVNGAPSARYETVHIDVENGQDLVFESVLAARMRDGRCEGFVGYSQDVTSTWRAARALRLLGSAVAHAADPIVLCDASMRIQVINRAFTEATGYVDEDCRGRDAAFLLSDRTTETVAEAMRMAMAAERPFHGTVLYRRRDDSTFSSEISVGPVFDDDERLIGFVNTFRDVTERDRLVEKRAHAQKMASIGSLAAGIAHELNTPAQFVSDNLSFLERAFMKVQPFLSHVRVLTARVSSTHDATHDPVRAIAGDEETLRLVDVLVRTAAEAKVDFLMGEIPEAIAQSREGIDRIARVVSATMDFARVSNAPKEPIDVGELLRSTVTVCKGMWNHVATFEVVVAGELPAVIGSRDELAQALVQLIENAGRAIEDAIASGLVRKGRVELHARREREAVVIRVTDDGAGIPVHIRHRIFEPFFTTRAVGEGRGEGLSFVHRVIVAEHHGHIDVVSEEGEGTAVTIMLPLGKQVGAAG